MLRRPRWDVAEEVNVEEQSSTAFNRGTWGEGTGFPVQQ